MRSLLRFRLNRFCTLTFGVFPCTLDTLIVIKFSRSDSSAHRSELQPSFSGSTKINSLVIRKRFKSADTVAYSSTRRELDLALARHSSRYSWPPCYPYKPPIHVINGCHQPLFEFCLLAAFTATATLLVTMKVNMAPTSSTKDFMTECIFPVVAEANLVIESPITAFTPESIDLMIVRSA